ncbi:hypothetical protein AB1Y20_022377 [Prymnesium parvum]|uniref:Uncharacterized protein n=1 Tax=Prymnesium parvum TaxID=97485 RepID=A0AB34JFQ2_PRYPA
MVMALCSLVCALRLQVPKPLHATPHAVPQAAPLAWLHSAPPLLPRVSPLRHAHVISLEVGDTIQFEDTRSFGPWWRGGRLREAVRRLLEPRSEAGFNRAAVRPDGRVVFAERSAHGNGIVRVNAHGAWRCLMTDEVEQGLAYIDRRTGALQPDVLGYQYLRVMAAAAVAFGALPSADSSPPPPAAGTFVCVGLGSGALPGFLAHHMLDVLVVEIDPVVVRAARDVIGAALLVEVQLLVEEQQAALLVEEQQAALLVEEQQAALLVEEQQAALLVEEQQAAPLVEEQQAALLVEEQQAAPLVEEQQAALLVEEQQAAPLVEEQQSDRPAERRSGVPVVLCDAALFMRRRARRHAEPSPSARTPEHIFAIFLDAFDANGSTPSHLLAPTFLDDCSAALAPGGVVVANLFNGAPRSPERRAFSAFANRLAKCVGPVYSFSVAGQLESVVLVARKGDATPRPGRRDIRRAARHGVRAHGFRSDYGRLLRGMHWVECCSNEQDVREYIPPRSAECNPLVQCPAFWADTLQLGTTAIDWL